MLDLNLCDEDIQYYNDLFEGCEPDATYETIQPIRLIKLLKSADMPSSIINNIMDLCGSVENTVNTAQNLTRKQFHAALKLTAAYQVGVPLRKEVLTKKHNFPLPKFIWTSVPVKQHTQTLQQINYKPHIDVFSTDSDENFTRPETDAVVNTNTNNNSQKDDLINEKSNCCWPTNSMYEEQIQLLPTEESDDRHSSDDDDNEDDGNLDKVYNEMSRISLEQKNNYVDEFHKIDVNNTSYLHYTQVFKYFESIHASNNDIQKVWKVIMGPKNLMSIDEFIRAMHLLWLKRNNKIFSIPKQLKCIQLPTKQYQNWTTFNESPVQDQKPLSPSLVNFDFPYENCTSQLIKRPQPKRFEGSENGPISLPPPLIMPPTIPKKDNPLPPPPPPPRPIRQHGRSSSLDLTRKCVVNQLPIVPPRPNSPSKKQGTYKTESFADFENQKDSMDLSLKMINSLNALSIPKKAQLQRHGAFEIYKKNPDLAVSSSANDTDSLSNGTIVTDQLAAINKSNWHAIYRQLKHDKTLLVQTCIDLRNELEIVKEDKLRLKSQLQQKQQLNAKPKF